MYFQLLETWAWIMVQRQSLLNNICPWIIKKCSSLWKQCFRYEENVSDTIQRPGMCLRFHISLIFLESSSALETWYNLWRKFQHFTVQPSFWPQLGLCSINHTELSSFYISLISCSSPSVFLNIKTSILQNIILVPCNALTYVGMA